AASGPVAVELTVTDWACASCTGAKVNGTVWAPRASEPSGAIVRAAPQSCTSTLTLTVAAAPEALEASVVGTVGLDSSLCPIGRTSTSPLSPPQLNHVR